MTNMYDVRNEETSTDRSSEEYRISNRELLERCGLLRKDPFMFSMFGGESSNTDRKYLR